jgi:enolase
VNGEIAQRLCGARFAGPADVDAALIELDGSVDKARLGANAIVGVSMAAARVAALAAGLPLWGCSHRRVSNPGCRSHIFNVVNGGAHAPNVLEFQEFMIAPIGAPNIAAAVRAGAEIYASLRHILSAKGMSTGLGDEGGFAPEVGSPEEVLALLVAAIEDGGYQTGRSGVAIAMDSARTLLTAMAHTMSVVRSCRATISSTAMKT